MTVTLGRTGSLVDLTSNVTLPSSGGGFSLQQIQDAMVSFLNFGSNITDTYDDPNSVYNIDAVNNYVDHLGATTAGQDLTITLGRTGSLADLQHTVTLPTGSGGGDDQGESVERQLATPSSSFRRLEARRQATAMTCGRADLIGGDGSG